MSSPISRFSFRFRRFCYNNHSRHLCDSANVRVLAGIDSRNFMESVRQQCDLGFPDLQIPLSLFRQMLCLVPRPSLFDFTRLFSAMLKLKRLQPYCTVINLSNQLELSSTRLDSHSIGILANCYSHLGRIDFGFSLLAKSLKLGYEFESDVVIFSTLINGFIENNQLPQALGLLDIAVVKLGIQPNLVTYNTMLKGLCRVGDKDGMIDEAQDIVRSMIDQGLSPDVITFTTLINGHVKLQNVHKAFDILQEMIQQGIVPDVYTFSTLIDGLCKCDGIPMARQLLNDMKIYGVKPNVVTYGSFLDGLCKSAQFDEAAVVLPEMVSDGVAPNIFIYNILIDGMCEAGQVKDAENLFYDLTLGCLAPNEITYNIMIKGLCKKGLTSRAIQFLDNIKRDGCFPDEVPYNTIIKGFIIEEDFLNALRFRDIIIDDGFQASASTISMFHARLSHDNPFLRHFVDFNARRL